jgi:tetratricopeptide (TPR) repeat protein
MSEPVFERYKEALKQGHVAMFKGKPKDALVHYQEAARLVSHRPLPYVNMGSVLLQMGRAQEAVAAYDDALLRAPDDLQALNGKASALLASGKRAEAEQVLRHVADLELDERRRAAEADADAKAAAWAGGPERLMVAAEQAEQAGKAAAAIEAYVGASSGYAEHDQLDAALDSCERALALSLGAPSVHLQMARIYFQRGWTELAVERLVLLDRLLGFEDDASAVDALRELARIHRGDDARLPALTGSRL